jgi:hypothetical protein
MIFLLPSPQTAGAATGLLEATSVGELYQLRPGVIIMEINTQSDSDTNNNSETPLPTPHFDAQMISQAQQVEPLDASGRRKWRPGSARDFFRGRLRVLAVAMVALLFGAAALGVLLGLRDARSSIEQPTADQAIPEPTNAEASPPPVKAQPAVAPPVKALAQRAEKTEPAPKPVSASERVRRTVRVSLDDIDQALSEKIVRPRKVGEYGGGRNDRIGRKGESRRLQRRDDNPE